MSVIIFGPTGNVASIAARTAHQHGAIVILAMRDPQKTIPGLNAEDEKSGNYERVQADLTKPDTVAAAVQKTNAKHAFIYLAHGSPDHMRGTIEALKSSGIDFVVFLSSFTIRDQELSDVEPSELIPFAHARVEMSLDEVFGSESYVAIRPGGFVTNLLRSQEGIRAGKVELFGPWLKYDCITPNDMGKVSGTILVHGPKNGQRKVYLYGPKEWSQRDAIAAIGKAISRDIKVTEIDEHAGREQMKDLGFPPPVVDYLARLIMEAKDGSGMVHVRYVEGVSNIEMYTGKPAQEFEDWVAANKELFQ
jgi:uncharacterized protein YbjT (DUF2867 family)